MFLRLQFLFILANLLLYATLCNGVCEIVSEYDITVDCAYSNLREVPSEEIPNDVQSLNLSNNMLRKLNASLWKNYILLESLYLNNNEISTIEKKTFSELKELSNLDLSRNRISRIPSDAFSSNPLLQRLNLRVNPELYIPPDSAFLISQSLVQLEMSSCQLSLLYPQTFSQLNLVSLDLSHNNLEKVQPEVFEPLGNLNTLDLKNNKWRCDCGIVDLLNTVLQRRVNMNLPIAFSPVKCVDNGKYKTLSTSVVFKESATVCAKTTEYTTIDRTSLKREISEFTETKNNHHMQNYERSTEVIEFSSTNTPDDSKEESTEVPEHKEFLNSSPELPNITKEESMTVTGESQTLNANTVILLCILFTISVISVFIAFVAIRMFLYFKDSKIVKSRDADEGILYYSGGYITPSSICGDENHYPVSLNINRKSNSTSVYHFYERIDEKNMYDNLNTQ